MTPWLPATVPALENELERQLNLAWGRCRLNLAKRGRADVVVRHAKVDPVQDIEEFTTEL